MHRPFIEGAQLASTAGAIMSFVSRYHTNWTVASPTLSVLTTEEASVGTKISPLPVNPLNAGASS
jgi:hypothetical protein